MERLEHARRSVLVTRAVPLRNSKKIFVKEQQMFTLLFGMFSIHLLLA